MRSRLLGLDAMEITFFQKWQAFHLLGKIFDSKIVPLQSRFEHKMSSTLIGGWIERYLQWNYDESITMHLLETSHSLHSLCILWMFFVYVFHLRKFVVEVCFSSSKISGGSFFGTLELAAYETSMGWSPWSFWRPWSLIQLWQLKFLVVLELDFSDWRLLNVLLWDLWESIYNSLEKE